jgi:hypothetical protein
MIMRLQDSVLKFLAKFQPGPPLIPVSLQASKQCF